MLLWYLNDRNGVADATGTRKMNEESPNIEPVEMMVGLAL